MILDKYEPSPAWFLHNPYGIHGIGHVSRVLVWADIITQEMINIGKSIDIEVVRWSAVLHDVGRHGDGRDPEHGIRSAQWLEENVAFLRHFDQERLDQVAECCTWHVPRDGVIPNLTNELICLKDADGLERVRIWDLDRRYLRTDSARGHVADAQLLFDMTRDASRDVWANVRSAARRKGWWR